MRDIGPRLGSNTREPLVHRNLGLLQVQTHGGRRSAFSIRRPLLGQSTDTNVSLPSQLTDPSVWTERTLVVAESPLSTFDAFFPKFLEDPAVLVHQLDLERRDALDPVRTENHSAVLQMKFPVSFSLCNGSRLVNPVCVVRSPPQTRPQAHAAGSRAVVA